MVKKLIILLPLVWIAAFVPHFIGLGRTHGDANGRPDGPTISPAVHPRQWTYYRSDHSDVTFFVNLQGRHVQCVSLDGSATGLAHTLCGKQIAFQVSSGMPSGCVVVRLLEPSVRGLSDGLQRVRMSMDDGSFVDVKLTIKDKRPKSVASPLGRRVAMRKNGILAPEQKYSGGNNERRVCGIGTARTVAALR